MITAARTASQVATHMAVAFAVMYALTGSVVFGGIAALVEPVVNVMLLPPHQKLWKRMRASGHPAWAHRVGEKLSQFGMHAGVAFATMYVATGSAVTGGLVLLIEPLCNVFVLPFHDRLWHRWQSRMANLVVI